MTEGPDDRPEYGAQPPPGPYRPPDPSRQPPYEQPTAEQQPQQAPWQQQPYPQQPYPQQPYAPPYPQPPGQPYAPPYGSQPSGAPGYGGPAGLPPGVRLATWGQRAIALVLDWLFAALLYIPGTVVLVIGAVRADDAGRVDGASAGLITVGSLLMLAAVVVQLWNQGWRNGSQGWSWGKQIMRIKLVRLADAQLAGGWVGLGRLLLRGFLGSITGGIYTVLTYLWPLWDQRVQTLDDKIWSTLVVDA